MFRNNNCFCKLRKRIEELETQINQNYSGDTNLANKVQQIKDELDENTANDVELKNRVDNMDAEVDNITPAEQGDIDNLFP